MIVFFCTYFSLFLHLTDLEILCIYPTTTRHLFSFKFLLNYNHILCQLLCGISLLNIPFGFFTNVHIQSKKCRWELYIEFQTWKDQTQKERERKRGIFSVENKREEAFSHVVNDNSKIPIMQWKRETSINPKMHVLAGPALNNAVWFLVLHLPTSLV